jgi:hypothetical protein
MTVIETQEWALNRRECGRRPMIIEAKPEPITVNCAETDVIVVDFIFRTGLFVKGSSPLGN